MCESKKKNLVVKEYATLNKSVTLVIDSNKCILTNNSANIPKISQRALKSNEKSPITDNSEHEVHIESAVPLEIIELCIEVERNSNIQELTPYISIEEHAANELVACIVSNGNWKNSVQEAYSDVDLTKKDEEIVSEIGTIFQEVPDRNAKEN